MKQILLMAAAAMMTLPVSFASATDIEAALALEGDPAAGERAFRKCQACHVVDQEQNRVGPHLVNVFGRQPGTVEGFRYSDALALYGQDKVWDRQSLANYIANPRSYIRGNRMAFAGIRQEQELADLLAYLAQFSKAPAQ